MVLKLKYEKKDEIPKGYEALYEEKDGKFVLVGVEGMKTQEDIDKVSEALRKERKDHKDTRDKLAKFGELDPDEVHTKLDSITSLEAQVAAAGDPKKLQDAVNAQLAAKMAPLERENKKLKDDAAKITEEVTTLRGEKRTRAIHDAVRAELVKAKVLDTAHEDALMLAERLFDVTDDGKVIAKDNVGITPGVGPDIWLTDIQAKRPHWWAPSQGGGGRPGGQGGGFMGNNPWSKDHWNLTEQGRIHREKGAEYAAQLAAQAGSKVGATHPTTTK